MLNLVAGGYILSKRSRNRQAAVGAYKLLELYTKMACEIPPTVPELSTFLYKLYPCYV